MITGEVIQRLKQSNISSDAEKTRARTAQIWKSTSRADQHKVLELSGLARPSVRRAYKTGNISAKLVIALAQVRGVSPLFLTGQSDEPSPCTDEALHGLLLTHGYKKLLADLPKEPRRRKKAEPSVETPPAVCADYALTDEELVLLLRAACVRARADAHHAAAVEKVKELLLNL